MLPIEDSSSGPYSGDGVNVSFPYDFRIRDEDYLEVFLVRPGVDDVTLVVNVDYSVTGVGDETGGGIEFPIAGSGHTTLAVDEELYILRDPPFTQETDLSTMGNYRPDTIENMADEIVKQTQRLKLLMDRALLAPVGESVDMDDFIFTDGRNDMDDGYYAVTPQDVVTLATLDGLTPSLGPADLRVDSIAGLRILGTPVDSNRVWVRGHSSVNDGGAGVFDWDATSDEEDDNGVTILPTGHIGIGRWVRNYSGAINVKWFGASGVIGTDSTPGLQAAINMLIQQKAQSLFVPHGTYDFTRLVFFDESDLVDPPDKKRGNFRFFGESPSTSQVGFLFQPQATIFNCTESTGDGFIVNYIHDRDAPYNFSMDRVLFENFTLNGTKSVGYTLMVADLTVNHSLFQNIGIRNSGAGDALRIWSGYTASWYNIFINGQVDAADTTLEGRGLFYDTDRGTGGLPTLENISSKKFQIGFHFGNDVGFEPVDNIVGGGGASGGKLLALQAIGNAHGLQVESKCYLEFYHFWGEGNTQATVIIDNGARVAFHSSTMFGHRQNDGSYMIHLKNTGGNKKQLLLLDGCIIGQTPYTEGRQIAGIILVYADTDTDVIINNTVTEIDGTELAVEFAGIYNGIMTLRNNTYDGVTTPNSTLWTNKIEYISAASNVPSLRQAIEGTLDLSARLNIPSKVLFWTTNAVGLLKLPTSEKLVDCDNGILVSKTDATSSLDLTIDAGVGNLINNDSVSAQTLVIAANRGFVKLVPMTITGGVVMWQVCGAAI